MPDDSDRFLHMMAPRRGHFRLASGHHGDLWLDLDVLSRRPAALAPFVTALAERLDRHRVDVVCGPLTGGAFLAQLIARELDVAFTYTEPIAPTCYRLPSGLHEDVTDKRIALVDDVINAGSAVRGTYRTVVAHGGRPVVVGALLVLGSAAAAFAAEVSMPLERLAHRPSTLWEPEHCPLCASGLPLNDT